MKQAAGSTNADQAAGASAKEIKCRLLMLRVDFGVPARWSLLGVEADIEQSASDKPVL